MILVHCEMNGLLTVMSSLVCLQVSMPSRRAETPSSILSSDSDIRFTRKVSGQYRCGCCVLAAFLTLLLVISIGVYLGCESDGLSCFIVSVVARRSAGTKGNTATGTLAWDDAHRKKRGRD